MTVLDTPRGREALTVVAAVGRGAGYSVVRCELHTGRTHQIRVHLRWLGHPVLGDPLYGHRHALAAPRLMLHAWGIGFRHPRDGSWREVVAPIPGEMVGFLLGAGLEPSRISCW